MVRSVNQSETSVTIRVRLGGPEVILDNAGRGADGYKAVC